MVQYRRGRNSPWMVQVRDPKGDVKTHSFSRKDDAEKFEREEHRKKQLMKAGLEAPQDEILFLDAVMTWLKNRSTGKQSSFRQDEGRLRNYWIEEFGTYPLQTMTTAMILARLDWIQFTRGHAAADRNRHRALLHKFFEDMYMAGRVVHNPVARIPLIKEVKRVDSGKIEPAHQDLYVQAMYAEGSNYGMMTDIMLWTGVRIMGAAALQWHDIDFEQRVVRLRRIVERATNSVQERTKGADEGGEELVPLLPILRDRLLTHHKQSEFIRPTDFVAAVPGSGTFTSYESYRDARERAIEKTKIPRFTAHALKKAFADNAKRAGLSRPEIQELFGHSSPQVTDRYLTKDISHLISRVESLQFGSSVSRVSAKTKLNPRIRGKK